MSQPAVDTMTLDLAPESTLLLLEVTQELLFLADRYDRLNDQPAWLQMSINRLELLHGTLERSMPWEDFIDWARQLTDIQGGPPSLAHRLR